MAGSNISPQLQAALMSGAEIGLSRAMYFGRDNERVQWYVARHLAELSPADMDYISRLAASILNAGEYMDSLADDEDVDPDQIPTNGYLFGEDDGGKRLFWWGEWNIPGTDEWYQFSGDLPDITDDEEIIQYAQGLAQNYIEEYPDKFAAGVDLPTEDINVRIIGTEKKF